MKKLLVASLLATTQAACLFDEPKRYSWDDDGSTFGRQGTPTRTFSQPTIDVVTIPEWPPLGPSGSVEVTCSSPNGTGSLTAQFSKRAFASVFTTSSPASFTGAELGEGFGNLVLTLRDSVGGGAERLVTNLLVDLGAPGVEIESSVLRPGGEIALQVYDAWVLGSVELTIDGTAQTHAFPKAYPSTLGKDFDLSRVTFPVTGVALGKSKAIVVVRDAAGNATSKTFDIQLDGTPPTVAISSPAAGATVPKHFDVAFSTSDDLAASPEVELRIGGGYAGTFSGNSGKITVDATGFGGGPLAIELIAIDEAGNRTTALRTVTVQ